MSHRVRKKSFIIMTILAPVLMAAIIILPTADDGEPGRRI